MYVCSGDSSINSPAGDSIIIMKCVKLLNKTTFMHKFKYLIYIFITAIYCLTGSMTYAQITGISDYTSSKNELLKKLRSRFISEKFNQHIDKFYQKSCDSLLKSGNRQEREQQMQLLTNLFRSSIKALDSKQITLLRIPGLNDYVLQTLRVNEPNQLLRLYDPVNISVHRILADVFQSTDKAGPISWSLELKDMAAFPYKIPNRIFLPRYAPIRDSLLYRYANEMPEAFCRKLASGDKDWVSLAENSQSRTVQAIRQVPVDIYFEKVLPFSMAILDQRATMEQVRSWAMEPSIYYARFTEELSYLHTRSNPEERRFLRRQMEVMNRKIAKAFFMNEINDSHEMPDYKRFASVQGLSARELYYVMLAGEDELYTSSFIYLFKLFIQKTGKQSLGDFFNEIGYHYFDRFLFVVNVYGMTPDLMDRLPQMDVLNQLKRNVRSLSRVRYESLDVIVNSMYLAEVLFELRKYDQVRIGLQPYLDSLQKSKSNELLLYRIYEGYRNILALGKNADIRMPGSEVYDVMEVDKLRHDGKIAGIVLFYDDEDGRSSFQHYIGTFESSKWTSRDESDYIIMQSKSGQPVFIFINKPNTADGYDSAQARMIRDVKRRGYKPGLFIHRGHSYYLQNSLSYLEPDHQFVFLGSCGGYQNVLQVFYNNLDAHVIATRKIGSMWVNDPLLNDVQNEIRANQDIYWNKIWESLSSQLKSAQTRELFSGYIPPNRYNGVIFIRQVFNIQ